MGSFRHRPRSYVTPSARSSDLPVLDRGMPSARSLRGPEGFPRGSASLRRRRVLVPTISILTIVALLVVLLPGGGLPPRSAAALVGSTQTALRHASSDDPSVPPPTETPTPRPTAMGPLLLRDYIWPLPNGRITLPFGPTDWGTYRVDGELFHDGVDMATFCGDHVVAAHSGVVLAAGRHFDDYIGWIGDLKPYYDRLDSKHAWIDLPITVIIDDGNGYRSIYAHFNEVTVKEGDHVEAGQMIGYEGDTGHATGCHVHYGLFSPLETATFALDPTIAEHMQLPATEIARVNPLFVLPWRWDVDEMKPLRTPPPGSTPPPSPSPSPTPSSSPSKR